MAGGASMSYESFLADNQHLFLTYYTLGQQHEGRFCIETPYPPAELADDELDALKNMLRDQMPVRSMMMDLWDWDIHFEEDLESDWFFEAAFGPVSSEENCAEDLADYFLEKADECSMDYNQHDDYEEFEKLVCAEAIKFIRDWRTNLMNSFLAADRSIQRLTV
jgi:hypothetical protein